MKLTSSIVMGVFTALTLAAVPACDDKKEDKKADDKKGDSKDAKADAKAGDAKADEGGEAAKADEGGEEAKADEGGEEAKADEGGEEAKADEGGEEAAEGGADAAADGGAAAGGEIGVPECDDYVVKYTKCIDEKLPDPVKETSRKAMQTVVDAWKKAAATPAGKEGLVQACKTATEAVKASCGW